MKLLFGVFLACSATICATAQDASPNDPNGEARAPQKEVHTHSTRIRVGAEITAAHLVNRVQPVYPPLARKTGISGTVRLHAIIGKDGAVKQLEVLYGHPMLLQSALDAVRQWKYSPTLREGQPVEVDTTIEVVYDLNSDQVQDSARQVPNIDPQFRKDMLFLLWETPQALEISDQAALTVFEKLRIQMLSNIKDEATRKKITDSYVSQLLKMFKTDAYSEGIVVVYSKYFNEDDVKELKKFYESPLGHKFNEAMPKFTADLMDHGQRMAQDSIPGIFEQLCNEFPNDLAGILPDCPAPDANRRSGLLPSPMNQPASPNPK